MSSDSSTTVDPAPATDSDTERERPGFRVAADVVAGSPATRRYELGQRDRARRSRPSDRAHDRTLQRQVAIKELTSASEHGPAPVRARRR